MRPSSPGLPGTVASETPAIGRISLHPLDRSSHEEAFRQTLASYRDILRAAVVLLAGVVVVAACHDHRAAGNAFELLGSRRRENEVVVGADGLVLWKLVQLPPPFSIAEACPKSVVRASAILEVQAR